MRFWTTILAAFAVAACVSYDTSPPSQDAGVDGREVSQSPDSPEWLNGPLGEPYDDQIKAKRAANDANDPDDYRPVGPPYGKCNEQPDAHLCQSTPSKEDTRCKWWVWGADNGDYYLYCECVDNREWWNRCT